MVDSSWFSKLDKETNFSDVNAIITVNWDGNAFFNTSGRFSSEAIYAVVSAAVPTTRKSKQNSLDWTPLEHIARDLLAKMVKHFAAVCSATLSQSESQLHIQKQKACNIDSTVLL